MTVISREEFEKNLKNRMLAKARDGECGDLAECEKDILTIYIMDEEGNVIHEDKGHVMNDRSGPPNKKRRSEWVDWIFENGLQDKYSVYTVREQVDNRVYYSPEVFAKIREKEIEWYESRLRDEEAEKKRKEERNARWREGCDWIRSLNGTKLPQNYCTRRTLIKNVVKLDIVASWNERYPEFRISEEEDAQWKRYWTAQRKKGSDD